MPEPIYLDYAAATPVDPEVVKLMLPFYSQKFFNPSADYAAAREVRGSLNEAREKVAYWLGAKADEIIFTAGGTEANNLAIRGVMEEHPASKVIYCSIDHDSVRIPASNYKRAEIAVMGDGRVDFTSLEALLGDEVVLVSINYANNEIGTVEPIREISSIISKYRKDRIWRGVKKPLLFHTDACQAANYLDLHVNRLGIDLMTLNGGKIYGPKQSGALYVRSGVVLRPQISGGGQEKNLRSGTENVPAIIGMSAALDKAQSERKPEASRLASLRDHFIERLETEIKGSSINGSLKYRLSNNIHVTFNGCDNEALLIELSNQGIQAAAGSACSAAKEEASHVLKAIGLSEADSRSSLRFSLGRGTTLADIDRTADVLIHLFERG